MTIRDSNISLQGEQWFTAEEQIQALKNKGVTFEKVSESEALDYLIQNNNYFRLGSYRRTWPKYESGEKEGKYKNLDFAALEDLSIIDMRLRKVLLPMTLDIEHFEKMRLLKRIEEEDDDPYAIVESFLKERDEKNDDGEVHNKIKDDIKRGKSSAYLCDLINSRPDFRYSAWELMEVIAFGTFIEFYRFCATRYNDSRMSQNYYMLQKVKSMRNACAHNNCILNNLSSGTSLYKTPYELSKQVGAIRGIGKNARQARLSNASLLDISATLFLHKEIASSGVHAHCAMELKEAIQRMYREIDLYEENLQILSSFNYLKLLIDAWF